MNMKDVKVGETYAFIKNYPDFQKRYLCVNSAGEEITAKPIVITDKELVNVTTTDNCGRLIPGRKTMLTAKLYNVTATDMRALDLDLVVKDDKKAVSTIQVDCRDIVSPWEIEVERARMRAEAVVKMHKAHQYLAMLGCIVGRRLYELAPPDDEYETVRVEGAAYKPEILAKSLYALSNDAEAANLIQQGLNHYGFMPTLLQDGDLSVTVTVDLKMPQDSRLYAEHEYGNVRLLRRFDVNLFALFAKKIGCPMPEIKTHSDDRKTGYFALVEKKYLPWQRKVAAVLAKTMQEERHELIAEALNILADKVSDFALREDIEKFSYWVSWDKELERVAKEVLTPKAAKEFVTLPPRFKQDEFDLQRES